MTTCCINSRSLSFTKFFNRLAKFATNSYFYHTLNTSLHYLVKYWLQSEIIIMINDKSQGSVAKYLSLDDFITNLSLNFVVKEFLKSVNIWRSVIHLRLLSSKMQNSPDK